MTEQATMVRNRTLESFWTVSISETGTIHQTDKYDLRVAHYRNKIQDYETDLCYFNGTIKNLYKRVVY